MIESLRVSEVTELKHRRRKRGQLRRKAQEIPQSGRSWSLEDVGWGVSSYGKMGGLGTRR